MVGFQRTQLLVGAWLLAVMLPALAQVPVVGFLNSQGEENFGHYLPAFRAGLESTGFKEGAGVAIEYRWARGDPAALPSLAGELVRRKVAIIVASGGDASTRAAKGATTTIPIVFGTASDPVQAGLVPSLRRPGGNATGVTLLAEPLNVKRLELARELLPSAAVIAVLINPDHPRAAARTKQLEAAARNMGLQVPILAARSEADFPKAFALAAERRAEAVVVAIDPLFLARRGRIIALAAQHRIPAIYPSDEFATDGGLISYGSDVAALYHQLGVLAGRILKGAQAGDLPVEQPTKFKMLVNARTARALSLTIPSALLVRADQVIE